jgi:putative intracellular protease/amidase
MAKKALYILSEYGYWGEELLGPLTHLDQAGYEATFVTPKGSRAHALPPSYDPDYFDPPLRCAVTNAETSAKVKALDDSDRLDNPVSLAEWFPERPYFSGPIIDMVNNQRVHDCILGFLHNEKVVSGICYGVAPLAFARELEGRKSIIWGKHVTGHCIEYDYKDGTGFLNTDLNMGPPPYPLEYLLRDAVGPDGGYHGNFGKRTSVIVDYPFATARSLQCSFEFGEKLVEMLEKGLKRYGW